MARAAKLGQLVFMVASFLRMIFIAAVAAAAAPVAAGPIATTSVVSCATGDCLLVRGHRASTGSIVRINDHAVTIEGKRSWKVRLPMDTVRAWAAPFARTVDVAIVDPAGTERAGTVRLPVGLLTQNQELALLVVHP